jgi:acetate kinase
MTAPLLIINAGSSSVRLGVYRAKENGAAVACVRSVRHEGVAADPHYLRDILGGENPSMVAHRVVHGGTLRRPSLIDDAVGAELQRASALAPLHNPLALAWIEACKMVFGATIPQLAVFDTSFFAELPPHVALYGLPRAFSEEHGVRRYGFHGIAHEAMWRAWCALRPDLPQGGRIITLQLGAGCSATAIEQGRPVETSMGFTPGEGLLMATRSGDIDPGLLIHLLRAGVDVDELEHMLMRDGGLKGLSSGLSSDMRVLLASDESAAELAISAYCHRARKYIGAYIATLGGVDGILFGGGVGEHLPAIRANIVQGLEAFGVLMDPDANAAAVGEAAKISAGESRIELRVQPVDEAGVMAETALRVLRKLK